MSKREKLKEFHRNNILEAAKRLFIEKGTAGTTMDDIAREADYSKTTLYAYFKSKDEIFSYIVYENMLLLKQSLVEAIKNNDTLESAYMAICQAHVDFHNNHPLYFESMVGNTTEPDDENQISKEIFDAGEEINQIIVDFLGFWIKAGKVKPDIDTLQTAFALWAGICGLITMTYNKPSYIACMKVSRQEFLNNSFMTLLNSIIV